MTDETPAAPPADRHPRSTVTRLPYLLVVGMVLLAAIVWGAITVRERATAEHEIIGFGDDPARVEQSIANPSR